MKETIYDQVLQEASFSDKEKKAFYEIINYAKVCMRNSKENLKSFISNKAEEVL